MDFRKKTIKTFEAIKKFGKQSLSQLVKITGSSKSSVHRQTKTINKRSSQLGAKFFESEEGFRWLTQFLIATLLVFGLQSNIGADKLSLFFTLIKIDGFIGTSPTSIRRLKIQMMELLKKYERQLLPKMNEVAKDKSLMAGADETFFEQLLIMVFMDLPSGFIFLEEQTNGRTFPIWLEHTKSFIGKFKGMLCLVSDRAKVLIKLSEHYCCESIADLFHAQMTVVKLLKFSFSAKLRSLDKQEKELKSLNEQEKLQLQEIGKKRDVINKGQAAYHQELHNISASVHPFTLSSEKQSTKEVSEKLNNSLCVLRKVVAACEINDKKNSLNKFKRQIKPLSALTDLWWQWVDCDLSYRTQDEEESQWVKGCLLPYIYWQQQICKSKSSKSLREFYKSIYNTAEKKLRNHNLTAKLLTSSWIDWTENICAKYQRTTSAIEGRNGILSECNHNARGMTKLQLKSQTIIHNYWIERVDGTTATERLFGFKPPNLFEWLVKNMGELPLPRYRNENKKATKFTQALVPNFA